MYHLKCICIITVDEVIVYIECLRIPKNIALNKQGAGDLITRIDPDRDNSGSLGVKYSPNPIAFSENPGEPNTFIL